MTEDNSVISKPKKMNPILAIICGVLCPGLGQVYTNRIKLASVLYGMFLFFVLIWIYVGLIWHFWGMVLYCVINYSLYLFAIIEAFIYAKKSDKRGLRLPVVMGIGILFLIILVIVILTSPYQAFKMPSETMAPTFEIGDHFIVNKGYYKGNLPVKRQLVAFHDPKGSSKLLVKRIVAISGDSLEIRNDSLYINNKFIQEPKEYWNNLAAAPYNLRNVEKHIVSPNSIYVLGDNRNNSFDSRQYGDVSIDLLVGKPLYVYWGKSLKRVGIQLE
jgi:signal peptidase I